MTSIVIIGSGACSIGLHLALIALAKTSVVVDVETRNQSTDNHNVFTLQKSEDLLVRPFRYVEAHQQPWYRRHPTSGKLNRY